MKEEEKENRKNKVGRKKGTPNRPKAINVMGKIVYTCTEKIDEYNTNIGQFPMGAGTSKEMLNGYSLACIAYELMLIRKKLDKLDTYKKGKDV